MSTSQESTSARPGAVDLFAATVMVVLCATWGLNQVAVKVASVEISPFVQAGLRSIFSGLLILAWCKYRGIKVFARDGSLWPGILVGLFFTIEFALFFVGVPRTSAARAVLFFYTTPFFVAIGAHFLLPGDRMTVSKLAGLVLAFFGVSLSFADALSSTAGQSGLTGDILCFTAAMFWAAVILTIKKTVLISIAPERALLYQLGVSGLLLPIGLLIGETLPSSLSFWPAVSFAYQVCLVASVSFLTFFWLMTKYDASRLSAFIFLAPAFGVFFGWLLLGESITLGLLAGAILICMGIWLVNRQD